MVFDAAAPIRRKSSASHSLETSLDEERRDVLKLLEGESKANRSQEDIKLLGQSSSPSHREKAEKFRFNLFPPAASSSTSKSTRYGSHTSPTERRSSVGSNLSTTSDGPDLHKAYRRLSNSAMAQYGGSFATMRPVEARRPSSTGSDSAPLEKDVDPDTAIASSSSEDEEGTDAGDNKSDSEKQPERRSFSMSGAIEEERLSVIENLKSASKPHANKSASHESANTSNRLPVLPNNSFVAGSRAVSPEVSDEEEDDREGLVNPDSLKFQLSSTAVIDNRTHQTLTRGDIQAVQEKAKRLRTYLIALDLSPESIYALEWTIGTVLRDGDTLNVVDAIEINDADRERQSAEDYQQERAKLLAQITDKLRSLLKRTRLQCICEIEIIHHPLTKHLITEMIDYGEPDMVILGSRGRGSLSSTLLGSFSNYIVSKSSVPVMVARKKLRKSKHRHKSEVVRSRMVNNLANAIVDEKGPISKKKEIWSPFRSRNS